MESWITGELHPKWTLLDAKAKVFRAEQGWRPFHWEMEFPEVFARDNPGFDAIVGNPPFAGKNTISAASGPRYLPWLLRLHEGAHGNADLVSHFFRRAFNLLRDGGAFGLIATNTIGQGDTRETGLATILRNGGSIRRAIKRYQWPNEGAAVVVSIVHVSKRERLDRLCSMVDRSIASPPISFPVNSTTHLRGSRKTRARLSLDHISLAWALRSMMQRRQRGEAESLETMRTLIARDPRNAERIKPYLGGEEINNSPTQEHHRHAIDFEDFPLQRDETLGPWAKMTTVEREAARRVGVVPADYPEPVAADWPDLLNIVEARLKGKRASHSTAQWWHFERRRGELYTAAEPLPNLLALARVSPMLAIAIVPPGTIFSDASVVFAYPNLAPFAVLQSRVHEVWARSFSSSMKDDLRYAPSDCFETFPFPLRYNTEAGLEAAAELITTTAPR